MSPVVKRNIIQFAMLIIALGAGYAIAGWLGMALGFGVFLIAMVIMTAVRMKRFNEKTAIAAEAAREFVAENEVPQQQVRYVKRPQDRKPKQAKATKTDSAD